MVTTFKFAYSIICLQNELLNIFFVIYFILQVSNTTEQCVTHAVSNQFSEFVGNVQNVLIMIYVLYVITRISTRFVIGFHDLPHLKVEGTYFN